VWTDIAYTTLHNASTWVWQAGGDFLSKDRKHILFDQPEALDGFVAYLRLYRYVPPQLKSVSWSDPYGYELLANRRVAVAMGPCGWFREVHKRIQDPNLLASLMVTAPPGPSFVGGSNLIVWQHTRLAQDALDLIEFLVGRRAQSDYSSQLSKLPVRLDLLAEPPYTTDPRNRVMAETLQIGRSYPSLRKWGAIEDRLARDLLWLWNSLLSNPDQDLESLVKSCIKAAARRLVVTLGIRE
jgi:ABC-type glycerol-3-phosphate transport system substrate-binding protein